jgi:heat shock protein HslJ
MTVRGTLIILLLSAFPAAAADPPMVCFGNEPSWGLHFADAVGARLELPGVPPAEYRGSATRLDFLHERIWRGQPAAGGGDLVAFLREATCSDGMSDTRHPVIARVSLADGRFLAGCCRMVAALAAVPQAATSIEGPTWRLTELRGLDPGVLRGAVRPVTANFKAGRISGFSGCNQFFGPYAVDGDRVTIGTLAGSMMACEGPSMKVENAVHAALAGTFRYVLADNRLTLQAGAVAVMAFQAEPAPALEGVTWKITGFNNGRQAVVSPLSGSTLSATFRGGWVEGFAGCNTFRATYTAEADRIVIGPVAQTRKACGGEGVMRQEREFLSALQSATTWGFMGRMLDLHRADGERVLTADGD